jgi:hypothetical protein
VKLGKYGKPEKLGIMVVLQNDASECPALRGEVAKDVWGVVVGDQVEQEDRVQTSGVTSLKVWL